ncbi:hypothetical protein LOTGIDRAFT_172253 [Lottia gigantea]|uniref:Uncharacterized protein n=1 Tax=Lottia gigantea TaxID=225164 RepID=V4AXE4_LOTGI|nr:hypothetical protein LOTGIDRAFT_172253 [Lottia gigantea]ESP02253.1 hypothetical protein LOTGIDRAFT_172253 [Lottia gigantea]
MGTCASSNNLTGATSSKSSGHNPIITISESSKNVPKPVSGTTSSPRLSETKLSSRNCVSNSPELNQLNPASAIVNSPEPFIGSPDSGLGHTGGTSGNGDTPNYVLLQNAVQKEDDNFDLKQLVCDERGDDYIEGKFDSIINFYRKSWDDVSRT